MVSRKCIITVIVSFSIIWLAQANYSPHWQDGEDGRVKWAPDCDFDSSFVRKVISRDDECGGLCVHEPECTRFLWTHENEGTCHLKSGNKKVHYAENDGICGYVTTEKVIASGISWVVADKSRIRWAANCDIAGNNIEALKTRGDMCGPRCFSHPDCIGFVWTNYEGGTCWLKSRGHPVIANNGPGGVCGEIIGRRASYGSASGTTRKSELACSEYTGIASHYKIVKGEISRKNEFPWMAALLYRLKDESLECRCGGTIISDYYILTAAHCTDPNPEIAQLGTHILNGASKMNMLVKNCFKHEHFVFEEYKNDIAVVELQQRITFGNRILPACLRVSSNDLPSDRELIATGWGITEDGRISEALRKTILRTADVSSCQADYQRRRPGPRIRINESQYCAVDPDGVRDVCKSVSGGPLQIFEDSTHSPLATVIGVASFRNGSYCPSSLPGVYTRVSFYLNWIEERVWDD